MTNNLVCKYCQSENVIKFGKYKDVQYYWCKDCKRKFSNPDAIPKMQYSTSKIADAISMYFEGMSLKEIRRNFIQQHNDYISDVTVLNWVNRFTDLAVKEAEKYKPDVGSIWVADETVLDIDGKNIWLWDIIDAKTRFLITTHMSFTRTSKDAEQLMKQAYERTGKIPRVIYTDRLRAYLEGIERVFGGDTSHKQGSPFDVESNTNYIERFHSTLKSRTKVMRGLHTIGSARKYLDGWLVHYNYFRPHMSLRDSTPAQVAGIRFPFRNWKDICQQPYEVTARIPIKQAMEILDIEPESMPVRARVIRPKKRKVTRRKITKRKAQKTPLVASMMQLRYKR